MGPLPAAEPAVFARPVRVAVVGKGGVGKTTIAAALARVLAQRGARVLAIDADPDANLATALPMDNEPPPTPLAQQPALLRAAALADELPTGLVQLNPDTQGLLPAGTAHWGGGQALVAIGWSQAGGQGCYCAEHAVLKRLLAQASRQQADVTVIDSEAGLEHLSRGTIAGVDLVLVVVEPGRRSVETAQAVRRLAADLDIEQVHPVVCGARDAAEAASVAGWLGAWAPVAGFPYDEEVRAADLEGRVPALTGPFLDAAQQLANAVAALCAAQSSRVPARSAEPWGSEEEAAA
jgi:CO dehydrogenase maturation factor